MSLQDRISAESVALSEHITGDIRDGVLELKGRYHLESGSSGVDELSLHAYAGSSPQVRGAEQFLRALRSDFRAYLQTEGFSPTDSAGGFFVGIDISAGAPDHLKHLYVDPHCLTYVLGGGFPCDDDQAYDFRIHSSRSVIALHPLSSDRGRSKRQELFEVARDASNEILLGYARTLNPGVSVS